MTTLYADYNGSSPLSQEVVDYLQTRLRKGPYGNPNSVHPDGKQVMAGLEMARSICAENIGAHNDQIIFNSGSTEGIMTVFNSLMSETSSGTEKKKTMILSDMEHPAVKNTAKFFQARGQHDLHFVPIDQNGIIRLEILEKLLDQNSKNLGLVAVMAANNETGVIQPIESISRLTNKYNVPFVCDTTQYIGKAHFNFEQSLIDYAFLSGHKIGAMTGIGFVLAKNPRSLLPLLHGGGQENSLRSGTQNYIGIETMAVALDNIEQKLRKWKHIELLKKNFEVEIRQRFPDTIIAGEESPRLPGTTFITYPRMNGHAIQIELESHGIHVSTSAACKDAHHTGSSILSTMGFEPHFATGAIRISLNYDSPENSYDVILDALTKTYLKLSKLNEHLNY